MNSYGLSWHPQGYSFTMEDLHASLCNFVSGAPYASRHWQLGNNPYHLEYRWGHRLIAVVESLPVLGAVAALIERIVALADTFFDRIVKAFPTVSRAFALVHNFRAARWEPRHLSVKASTKKMWKNSLKAIREHLQKNNCYRNAQIATDDDGYAQLEEALPLLDVFHKPKIEAPLKFTHSRAEAQGLRLNMEDAIFYSEISRGCVAGVFDGHGGKNVSEFARDYFVLNFEEKLQKNNGDPFRTFETMICEIQEYVSKIPAWFTNGSTAVVSFVDKHTHLVYTATLGDSEANIYRTIEGKMKSIPLSCVRDWGSKKDARRASLALQRPEIEHEWPSAPNPKTLRIGFPGTAHLNVSRAIGDRDCAGSELFPGVIHKPKITINRVQSGDTLVLACDGLKDYATETAIASQIRAYLFNEAQGAASKIPLAKQLVDFAITKANSDDNVSVVTIQVH